MMPTKFLRASTRGQLTNLKSMTYHMDGDTSIGETPPRAATVDWLRRILLTAFAPGGIFAWYRLVFEN
jgi:hypothetical protein